MPETTMTTVPQRAIRRRGHWGFTMVELIVMMVVLAIVSAVAIPRLTQLGSFKDVAYRDEIKAVLAYARKAAVARRRYTCVVFAAGTSVATVSAELVTPDAHVGSCPYAALKTPSGLSNSTPPSGVSITSPALPLTIQFNPEGKPTVGGGTTIVVTNSANSNTSSVTVEAESGYVH